MATRRAAARGLQLEKVARPRSGKTDSLTQTLRAIENAYGVKGVHRVSSEIQSSDN